MKQTRMGNLGGSHIKQSPVLFHRSCFSNAYLFSGPRYFLPWVVKHLKATGPEMGEDEVTKLEWGTLCHLKCHPFVCPRRGGYQSSVWGCLHAWGPWGHAAVGTFELGLGEYVGVCQIQKKREGEREALISGRKWCVLRVDWGGA